MKRADLKFWLGVIAIAVLIGGETAVWIHAYATCDGHVLKNAFDWPVCVR